MDVRPRPELPDRVNFGRPTTQMWVQNVWAAVIGFFTDISLLSRLLKHQQAYADDPDNEGLPARTARMGSGLTALAAVSTPARHPRRLTPGIPPTREDSPQ